jgi:hypothetical protein
MQDYERRVHSGHSWYMHESPLPQSYPRFIMKMLRERTVILFDYEVFCHQ